MLWIIIHGKTCSGDTGYDNLNIKNVVNELYQGVDGSPLITEPIYEIIRAVDTGREATALFFDFLRKTGTQNFTNFLTILRNTQDDYCVHEEIADRLELDLPAAVSFVCLSYSNPEGEVVTPFVSFLSYTLSPLIHQSSIVHLFIPAHKSIPVL